MINEYHRDFYVVLGYLTSPVRITKLDIETRPNGRTKVESQYLYLSGEPLVEDDVNYYVWGSHVNKWGSELRVYFNKNSNIPQDLDNITVTPRFPGHKYNARVNGNEFVWSLIKYGFKAKDNQDENLIRTKVPPSRISQFDQGYKL